MNIFTFDPLDAHIYKHDELAAGLKFRVPRQVPYCKMKLGDCLISTNGLQAVYVYDIKPDGADYLSLVAGPFSQAMIEKYIYK